MHDLSLVELCLSLTMKKDEELSKKIVYYFRLFRPSIFDGFIAIFFCRHYSLMHKHDFGVPLLPLHHQL